MRRVLFSAVLLFAAVAAETKRAFGPLLAAALALGAASSTASATAFEGRLGISGTLGALTFAGASSGTSTANNVAIPGGTFTGTVTVAVTSTPLFTAIKVAVAGNAAGNFNGNPLTGRMPINGGAAVKGNLGGGPITLAGVPLFTAHNPGSSAGANGVGVGGSVQITTSTNAAYLRVFNTNWSEGAKTVTGLMYTYIYHVPVGMLASRTHQYPFLNGTAMYTGTDNRTPGGLGQVTLVSPTKVVTNFNGALLIFVAPVSLTLKFVPEPGTLLLLGLGVAVLGALGRLRMHQD